MKNKTRKDKKELRRDEKMARGVARWSAAFGLSFQHVLVNVGARVMPVAAGIVFSFGVYEFVRALGYESWSAPVAAAVAIGIAAIGFKSAHTVMDAVENGRSLTVPLSLFIAYIAIGGGSVWLTDADSGQQVFTSMVFFLDAVMYLLLGMDTVRRNHARGEARAAVSVADEKAAADALARVQKLEDERIDFDRKEEAKVATHKRAMDKQAVVHMSPALSPIGTPAPTSATNQSSGVSLSPVRKGQLSAVYGQLDFDTAVTRADIVDMLGVKAKTAGRVLAAGNEAGVFVTRADGKRGEHFKNGVDPDTL